MKRTRLQDWLAVEGNTQTGLARTVGVTQGAINQMARSTRAIFVIEEGDSLRLEEVRRLGKSDPAAENGNIAAEA